MDNKIVIIGASGHGKVVADIAKKNGYTDIIFLDDNMDLKQCGEYPVAGQSQEIEPYRSCDFFVAIGNAAVRRKLQDRLEESGMHIATLIHPNAVIAEDVNIGIGTTIMAGAVINPGTVIGKGCIINTCASVDHDCILGEYVHVSVGAHVAGTVQIGNNAWVGAGATISNDIYITGDCMIGAGAVVIRNLDEEGTYVGVPVRKINESSRRMV